MNTNSNTSIFGSINKHEDNLDGTLSILGCVSSDVVDAHGERITADAMRKAIPEYMKWATIKEMHKSNTAVGVAKSLEVDENGNTWIECILADKEAILKVKTGTFKGFSLGGDQVVRDAINKSIIIGFRMNEISLVDRPANPKAMFSVFKADFNENELGNQEPEVAPEVVEPIVAPIVEQEQSIETSQVEVAPVIEEPIVAPEVVEPEVAPIIENNEVDSETEKGLLTNNELNIDNNLTNTNNFANVNNEMLLKYEILNKSYNEVIEKSIKLEKENEVLLKRIDVLEAQPEPSKAILFSISKNADNSNKDVVEIEPVYFTGTKEVNETATAIKKAMFGSK